VFEWQANVAGVVDTFVGAGGAVNSATILYGPLLEWKADAKADAAGVVDTF
jgi:hypothetical protein